MSNLSPVAVAAAVAALLVTPVHLRAQTSGVLLGVSAPDADHGSATTLLTYWIVGGARGAEVKAILPGLLVPQANGFRRIGIYQTCGLILELSDGVNGPHKGDVSCDERYWVGPGDASPPPHRMPPGANVADTPCSYSSRSIDFVSKDLVAIRAYDGQSESCEPRGWKGSEATFVRSIDGQTPVSLADVFGGGAAAAYDAAAEVAERELATEMGDIYEASCRVDRADLAKWTIVRSRGTWEPTLFQQDGPGWCTLVAPLKLRLPAHLLGPTRVAVPWTLLGGFDDAVSSPDGRWTLALDRNGLSFVRGPKPARPHRVVPDTQVVMVEWATGAHVARWSTFIERLPQVTDVAGGPAPLAAR